MERPQKQRDYKQEEKRKLNRKNGRELSADKLYTINLSQKQMETPFRYQITLNGEYTRNMCLNAESVQI